MEYRDAAYINRVRQYGRPLSIVGMCNRCRLLFSPHVSVAERKEVQRIERLTRKFIRELDDNELIHPLSITSDRKNKICKKPELDRNETKLIVDFIQKLRSEYEKELEGQDKDR